MGFAKVYDLIGGRAAWTALGLPTEGSVGDRRRISNHLADAVRVALDATIADVVQLGAQRFPVAVVHDGVLVGAVDPTARALPADTPVERVMVPAPGTVRPELRIEEAVEQLRTDGLDHVFVTAVDGTLRGMLITENLHV